MKYLTPCLACCLAVVLTPVTGQTTPPNALPFNATAYPVAPAQGLYQALGEKVGIRKVMDDLVVRLKADPQIGEQFKKTKSEHLAAQLTDQICQLAKGPCVYDGPTMKEAHGEMDISRADFNRLVQLAQAAMSAQGVSFSRQNQLLALLAPMHRDVITLP